jgi:hypothetical protein
MMAIVFYLIMAFFMPIFFIVFRNKLNNPPPVTDFEQFCIVALVWPAVLGLVLWDELVLAFGGLDKFIDWLHKVSE